ncbi:MAG: histidine phosphatase family protein [Rubrivivax sp.]|nr:histidine phosphatase family protein [Rubrivivax sp.]
MPHRRDVLAAGLALPFAPLPGLAGDDAGAEPLIRAGGVVVAFRHALAPGTFDPPGFTIDDCRTQRNLDDEGRAQARRIGEWFQRRQLRPAAVRSSPWCRCVDTATLAFGHAEPWPALGSPRGSPEQTSTGHLQQLRTALQAAGTRAGRFEVWVTHMFVLSALVRQGTGSGEGLVLRAGPVGEVQVLARLAPA